MRHGNGIISLFSALLMLLTVCAIPVYADVFGDVNFDGKVTAEDARVILRLSVGIDSSLTENADLNCDGRIGADDARYALRISLGLPGDTPASRGISDGVITGYTDKGYPIYDVNGVTFIDGIIIANKTYSLPESYDPGSLMPDCVDAFAEMQKAAEKLGLSVYISSGFRSYASQKSIYNRYVSRDGKRLADTYSARPGYSEHQTGLAIDLNTITQSFGGTAEGKWVAAHCHEYGFIIRYPEGKSHITGYRYEPWHLRYVGVETATKIAESGLCLEEYYGITSTYEL